MACLASLFSWRRRGGYVTLMSENARFFALVSWRVRRRERRGRRGFVRRLGAWIGSVDRERGWMGRRSVGGKVERESTAKCSNSMGFATASRNTAKHMSQPPTILYGHGIYQTPKSQSKAPPTPSSSQELPSHPSIHALDLPTLQYHGTSPYEVPPPHH